MNPTACVIVCCLLPLPALQAQTPDQPMDHSSHLAHPSLHAPPNPTSHPVPHPAPQSVHAGHQMQFDAQGMVMNSNHEQLPLNCASISADVAFTVHAGVSQAEKFPGRSFAYSQHDFQVPPCSRVTITFVNDDAVRHQWMMHGLPRYLYPMGMFHLEASGGHSVTGSFIVPADDATFLVHCDVTQHMEKGMKAQLMVGRGQGNLWSVPGVSDDFVTDGSRPRPLWPIGTGVMIALGISAIIARRKGE